MNPRNYQHLQADAKRGGDLPTFHSFILRSLLALNFLAKRQLSSKTPMNLSRCSAGMVLYTSSF